MKKYDLFPVFWIVFFVGAGIVLGYLISSQPHLEQSDFLKWERPFFFDESKISWQYDGILLKIPNANISTNRSDTNKTGSMFPTIIGGEKLLWLTIFEKRDFHVGDIIVFQRASDKNAISHRIVEMGEDSAGWFVITQGDNVNIPDGKVRFDEIKAKVIGVLY